MSEPAKQRPRLLIEEWLPIAEIGIESVRERTPMTPFPAPNRLHVWWARRPLVASRAAVLASLLPADADREKFLHMLGIHGDPVEAKLRMAEASRNIDSVTGMRENLGPNPYGYERAFKYSGTDDEHAWFLSETKRAGFPEVPVILDPTAGGGSIPFEAARLGLNIVANDLNPVAWLILKATVEFPAKHGQRLLTRYRQLSQRFGELAEPRFTGIFPKEDEGVIIDGYLWARTVICPYCNGLVPLSPNWKLDSKWAGVRLVPHTDDPHHRRCTFEIVQKAKDHSAGTVKGGNGLCPYPDCGRGIDSDEIKAQAQAGRMGQQLYAVVFKRKQVVGYTKSGKPKIKSIRDFRAPRAEDDVDEQVQAALDAKLPEWQARNIVPDEDVPPGHKTGDPGGEGSGTDKPLKAGMWKWRDMFSPRQLFGHCTSVEVFHDLIDSVRHENCGEIAPVDAAALTYLAIGIDKSLNYNSIASRWDTVRVAIRGKFDRHDFAFQWSFGEMAPTITGVGYDWVIESTGKSLQELIAMIRADHNTPLLLANDEKSVRISLASADALDLADGSVDAIVMDPPYYDNVMYAELSDFFYVWLKRTAGLIFPAAFVDYLSDKDREAVANPAKFKGHEGGAKNLAGRDYQDRMAAIFAECRRVLKPNGVMTVMFTHKASGAWDALASGLVQAGFEITASWPINTEAEGSLHIKEKSAAKSTIFLVCRIRPQRDADGDAVYWEEVEPRVQQAVRQRIGEFQAAGIGGIDLYLASFGPALQVFSESWPLQRGRAVQKPSGKQSKLFDDWDPYAVRPEDALDAARREVKRWRMEHLATVKRQHHLDPLSEWYVLAWDAFRAPRFPTDEALKLARVVGLDFDREVKNRVCEVKSSDVMLWDSKTRKAKGKLGPVGEAVMLDTLHQAAVVGRDQNTGVAKTLIEDAGLLADATLLTALEALLNVLPPVGSASSKKADPLLTGASSDFEALEKLRRLAFAEEVPAPKDVQLTLPGVDSD
jgi:putative DNA methylase